MASTEQMTDRKKVTQLERLGQAMLKERSNWWKHWQELAQYYLPRRLETLRNENMLGGYAPNYPYTQGRKVPYENTKILDPTGTQAARVLAAGLLNGVTSPSRPWYRLKPANDAKNLSLASRAFFDERRARGLYVISKSNFYQSMINIYFDLAVFGIGVMLVYEDRKTVINCNPLSIGEYALMKDNRGRLTTLFREFPRTIEQVVKEFGLENCSKEVKAAWDAAKNSTNSQRLLEYVSISHMIQPTDDGRWVEHYWETRKSEGMFLRKKFFRSNPIVTFRWDAAANDVYATSPGMYALADTKQLQQQTLRKAQGIDKMVSPPVVADIRLAHKPTALVPNGVTYAHMNGTSSNTGIRPAYQVQIPVLELRQDIQEVQQRVEEFFHNDLFRMISQLNTVRSATEIDALVSERLTLLAPVLERVETDGLSVFIERLDDIMERAGLFSDMEIPQELEGAPVDVQFISVLADAQTAVAAGPIERFAAFVGNIAGAMPPILQKVDWDKTVEQYGSALQISGGIIREQEDVDEERAQEAQQNAALQSAEAASKLAPAAKVLSETDAQGGALGALLGA